MLETYFEEILDPKDLWFHIRKKHWDRFVQSGFLEGKRSAFQYVPMETFSWPKPAERTEDLSLSLDGFRIVFIDGFLSIKHSKLPSEVIFLSLDMAMKSFGIFLQNRINRLLKEEKDPMALLNGALQRAGAFLYIPPEVRLSDPIHVYHFSTAPLLASSRLIVSLGKNASLTLIEKNNAASSVGNLYTEIALDENAQVDFHSCVEADAKAVVFQTFRSFLKKRAQLKYRFYSQGAEIVRNSIHVQLLEEESEASLRGLAVLDQQRRNHVHALVEHMAPHTRSRQHFKAALRGSSLSSFEGKIHVHPIAQKTEGYQLCNHLLLSDTAAAFAKPNLEIFADDVKASHGATISQLNEEELFYLRSRGLSKEEAKVYLIEGFMDELRDCLPKKGL